MVEKARRERIETEERANPTAQWELFCREAEGDPLRHVGSVAAASATEAHEHASRLFGWYAVDCWVCPADAVERYSARGLAAETDDRADDGGDESDASDESDTPAESSMPDEPRVYEETEGTPEVRDR